MFLKELARRALMATELGSAWLCYRAHPLHEDGWVRSCKEHRPIDRAGNPVPWITYPAIEFLSRRTRPDMFVFEYGSGASTLWWASRVERVISVEHDPDWARRVSAVAPANTKVLHIPLVPEEPYVTSARTQGIGFDVVVIDGRRRVECVPHAMAALKPGGVIILDNTDRPEYESGLRLLAEAGFRKIEFVGLAPMIAIKSETSVWYRPGNCLGL